MQLSGVSPSVCLSVCLSVSRLFRCDSGEAALIMRAVPRL